jgi:hypothetical protein
METKRFDSINNTILTVIIIPVILGVLAWTIKIGNTRELIGTTITLIITLCPLWISLLLLVLRPKKTDDFRASVNYLISSIIIFLIGFIINS